MPTLPEIKGLQVCALSHSAAIIMFKNPFSKQKIGPVASYRADASGHIGASRHGVS
jgi:hypothetical protein